MEKDILYLCDQRACDRCNSTRDSNPCRHTVDISHAKNFEKDQDGNYWEKEPKPLIIFKSNTPLRTEVMEHIKKELREQVATGVIFCGPSIDLIKITSYGKIYNVAITQEQEVTDESQG